MEMNLQQLRHAFETFGYIADDDVIMTTYLALVLQKPLLIEGAPGVGKTEMAKLLSSVFGTELIRLQCYEGLDESRALYEWNYQRQLLKIQLYKNCSVSDLEKSLFDREYLLERPLLKALVAPQKATLLIDEIDKTDAQFEAFLFELLSDFQISIPELGTVRSQHIPIVILTSNNERELSDGLRRRCIYLYIDYPSIKKEVAILEAKIPDIQRKLAREIAVALSIIRQRNDIDKKPAISETLDWARALIALGVDTLDARAIQATLGLLLKRESDLATLRNQLGADPLCKMIKECLQKEWEA
jgi:MoxR-like ATPase